MCGALGVLSLLSTSLANAGVTFKAIAQGASEFTITFVDTTAAPRAMMRFTMSSSRTLKLNLEILLNGMS